MSWGRRSLSLRTSSCGSIAFLMRRWATCAAAWTPASVRPAPPTATAPATCEAARMRWPWIVFGVVPCACQPEERVPSYSDRNARVRASGAADVDVACDLRGGADEVALDRFRRVTLRLPAGVASSLVFDREPVSRHAPYIVANPRRFARRRLGRRPRIILSARRAPPRLPLRRLLRRARPVRPHVRRPPAQVHAAVVPDRQPDADRQLRAAAELDGRAQLRDLDVREVAGGVSVRSVRR